MKKFIHTMKTILLIVFVLLSLSTLHAQNENFKRAMFDNFEKSKSAMSPAELQELANSYARIAATERNEWTAWYYAALCNLEINFQDPDMGRKEKFLALAREQVETGLKLKPEETELYVLKVMCYYGEMSIDPMKGMTLMAEANELLNQAKSVNPDNPRIYLTEAEAVYNTPVEYGGGKEKAMPFLLVAKEKFDNFTSDNPLAPAWGKERCEYLINEAK